MAALDGLIQRSFLNNLVKSDPIFEVPAGGWRFSGFEHNDEWTTAKFVRRKFRPTGGYDRHRFKLLLSVCCRALLFALDVISDSTISVRSAPTVTKRFAAMNAKLHQIPDEKMLFKYETDVDNFFNKISW